LDDAIEFDSRFCIGGIGRRLFDRACHRRGGPMCAMSVVGTAGAGEKSEYRRVRVIGTTGDNFLGDLLHRF
jgi:hypothetical protein